MVLRRAKKGAHAGQGFWGCSMFALFWWGGGGGGDAPLVVPAAAVIASPVVAAIITVPESEAERY
jgi:hypothetical protein